MCVRAGCTHARLCQEAMCVCVYYNVPTFCFVFCLSFFFIEEETIRWTTSYSIVHPTNKENTNNFEKEKTKTKRKKILVSSRFTVAAALVRCLEIAAPTAIWQMGDQVKN